MGYKRKTKRKKLMKNILYILIIFLQNKPIYALVVKRRSASILFC